MSTGNAAFGDLLWRADEEEVTGPGAPAPGRQGSENARAWLIALLIAAIDVSGHVSAEEAAPSDSVHQMRQHVANQDG